MNEQNELDMGGRPEPELTLPTLADGPAPKAPPPPVEPPVYNPAPQPVYEAPAPKKQAVRRVGTFTLGIALIITGLCITASFVMPNFDLVLVAKMSPLVLVALGLEILWATIRRGDAKLKYDFLSMFTCFILICSSLAVACVPVMWKYFGPERYATENRLQNELQQQLYPALSNLGVSDCSIYVDLLESNVEFDKNMTIGQLTAQDYVRARVEFSGSFATSEEFVAACQKALAAFEQTPVNSVDFSAQGKTDWWQLDVGGVFGMNATAETLAESVSHQIMVLDNGESYWYDAEAWANRQA